MLKIKRFIAGPGVDKEKKGSAKSVNKTTKVKKNKSEVKKPKLDKKLDEQTKRSRSIHHKAIGLDNITPLSDRRKSKSSILHRRKSKALTNESSRPRFLRNKSSIPDRKYSTTRYTLTSRNRFSNDTKARGGDGRGNWTYKRSWTPDCMPKPRMRCRTATSYKSMDNASFLSNSDTEVETFKTYRPSAVTDYGYSSRNRMPSQYLPRNLERSRLRRNPLTVGYVSNCPSVSFSPDTKPLRQKLGSSTIRCFCEYCMDVVNRRPTHCKFYQWPSFEPMR